MAGSSARNQGGTHAHPPMVYTQGTRLLETHSRVMLHVMNIGHGLILRLEELAGVSVALWIFSSSAPRRPCLSSESVIDGKFVGKQQIDCLEYMTAATRQK
ncbi:hypothetical protein Tco_0855429 [Tanacetum coccineum]